MPRIVPYAETNEAFREKVRGANARFVTQVLVDSSVVGSSQQLILRDWFPKHGGSPEVDDGVVFSTSVTNSQIDWLIDGSTELGTTPNTTWNEIIANGQEIGTKKALAIFGFWDQTVSPSIVAVRWTRGAEVLDLWHTQVCYSYGANSPQAGIVPASLLFEPQDPIKMEVLTKDSSPGDQTWGLYSYLSERAGDVIAR